MPRYLVYFYHRYLDFRLPELDAVLKIHGIDDIEAVYAAPTPTDPSKTPTPFLQVELPTDEIAESIGARCVLIKGMYRFLARADTYASLQDFLVDHGPLHTEQESWSLWVDCFGKKLSLNDQDARRSKVTSAVHFPGNVQLKNADRTYWLFEDRGIAADETEPKQLFLGLQLASSGKPTTRQFIDKHKLKKRKFIGPTSMDHELSLLMANLALVDKNSFVCDPFVGTASVLVACAQYGAICLGGDIDPQALHGIGNGVNISSNFDQYALTSPELLQWDVSRAPIRPNLEWFDAILCDPPYGLRESAQVTSSGKPTAIAPQNILLSLLEYAATRLKIGGRLVYVMACQKRPTEDYALHVPVHGAFKMVHLCVQEMTRKWVRLFLIMERRKAASGEQMRIGTALKDIGK